MFAYKLKDDAQTAMFHLRLIQTTLLLSIKCGSKLLKQFCKS